MAEWLPPNLTLGSGEKEDQSTVFASPSLPSARTTRASPSVCAGEHFKEAPQRFLAADLGNASTGALAHHQSGSRVA